MHAPLRRDGTKPQLGSGLGRSWHDIYLEVSGSQQEFPDTKKVQKDHPAPRLPWVHLGLS
jgi:hypothetical protein